MGAGLRIDGQRGQLTGTAKITVLVTHRPANVRKADQISYRNGVGSWSRAATTT